MTLIMDKLFIKIGFEAEDLNACDIRGTLYIGMIFSIGMGSAFGTMAMLG